MKNYFFLFLSMTLMILMPFQATSAAAMCEFVQPGVSIDTPPDAVKSACKKAKEQCQQNCMGTMMGFPKLSDKNKQLCANGDNACGKFGGLVTPGSWACTPEKAALFKKKGLSGC